VLPVLFQSIGRHDGQVLGRSPYLQAVHAAGPRSLIGRTVPVRIVEAMANSLRGDVESGGVQHGRAGETAMEETVCA